MTTRLKLRPGQRGTKKLLEIYGDALLCMRYRYDVETRTKMKTVELIVEKTEWIPPPPRFPADEVVPVRIAYVERECKRMARAAGGVWDPDARVWFIPYGKIKDTILEKHIVLDASKTTTE